MLALSGLTDVFKVIGILYLLLLVGAFALAIWLGYKKRWVWMTIVLVVFGYYPVKVNIEGYQRKQIYEAQKALFDKRCENAGVKIYKTVENVEGILLLKVRPKREEKDMSDPMWPGAPFVHEYSEEQYITSFLFFRSDTTVAQKVTENPGYKFVDVIEADGKRYRYTATYKARTDDYYIKLSWIDYEIKKELTTEPAPRYAVTYEDDLNPADRAQWVAGSTAKVLDMQTNEVLGTFTRYAVEYGQGGNTNQRTPWALAYKCGESGGKNAAIPTRHFVDQILKPTPIQATN